MDGKRISPSTRTLDSGPALPDRDDVLASALRRLHRTLHPSTCTVYLLTGDSRELAAAMTVDTPLSFMITHRLAVDDIRFSTARALRTGELIVQDGDELRGLARHSPELLLNAPFPLQVVSLPIGPPGNRIGALALRWVPPRTLSRGQRATLRGVGTELTAALEELAEHGVSLEAPTAPRFISAVPQDAGDAATADAASGTTSLYRLQKLTSALSAATRTRDVVTAADAQLVRPFDCRAIMLCLVRKGRLRVVGSAGFSQEAIRQVQGRVLSLHTPETDVITAAEAVFCATPEEVRKTYPDILHDPDAQPRAYVPLISHGRIMGCCVMEFRSSAPELRFEERGILMMMLEQVGQALERVGSFEATVELNRTMQRSLLPRALPHVPEAVMTARYLPAGESAEVGGDWYDAIRLPDGGIGLVIGDVEGHNLDAVGVMGQVRSAVRAYAAEGHEPAAVLERCNRLLAGLETDLYATCCCMWLDVATGLASVATAGHPPPLIACAEGGLEPSPSVPGPPLGIDAGVAYGATEVQLLPGSVVALFTDGLPAVRRLGMDAAMERLARVLCENAMDDPELLADRLVEDCRARADGDDDVALLVLRYEGAGPDAHGRAARTSVQRHDLQGVAHVRHFLHELLPRWGLTPLLADLELLASEVVTNALIHAHSEVDVRLRRYADRVRVEVRDSDPHPPVPTEILSNDQANQEAESGRGLLIVEALATAWGSSPAGRGKTTWFELALPATSGQDRLDAE